MKGTANKATVALDAQKVKDMESLLLLFPPSELEQFYAEHSQQMLLTTKADIERHEALQKLLQILKGSNRNS